MSKNVGIFGLGLIGTALAGRLLAAGNNVSGTDVDGEREALLAEMGGTPAVAEDLWQCDLLISAVFSTDQLADIIADAPPDTGKVLVTMSTCDPDQVADLAATASQKGITLVEAPISGTSLQVQQGTALLLLAGDAAGLDVFEEVADAITPNRERVGAIGNGNKMKLAINCTLGLNRVAVAEGLVFAEALGLSSQTFLDTALKSAAKSAVMASKGQMMVDRNFAPLGRIAQCHKDAILIREMAARNGHGSLPMIGRYIEVTENSLAAGEADLDNSGVFHAVARMAKR